MAIVTPYSSLKGLFSSINGQNVKIKVQLKLNAEESFEVDKDSPNES